MRLLLKGAVVLAPVLLIVGLLRLCEGDSGRRWLARVQEVEPELVLAIDEPELIAIGPDRELGGLMGGLALAFRHQLADGFGDLLGTGVDRRLVVIVFGRTSSIAEFAGRNVTVDRRSLTDVVGLAVPTRNAIYLPPTVDQATMKHEVTHLLMGQSAPPSVRFSPWLSEGLAQYFERYEPPALPRLDAEQRAFLRLGLGNRALDVSALIRLQDKSEFLQNDGALNYLRSRTLVSFLMETQPRERMRDYIEAEKQGGGDRYRLFKRIFGDPETMGSAVAAYLRS